MAKTAWVRDNMSEQPDKDGKLTWWAEWTDDNGRKRGQIFRLSNEDVAKRKMEPALPRSGLVSNRGRDVKIDRSRP